MVGRRSVRVASSFISRSSSLLSPSDNGNDRSNHSFLISQSQRQTLFENKHDHRSNQSNTNGGSRRWQCLHQHTVDDLFKVARTILCIYLSVSIPLRFAFIPQFGIRIFDQQQTQTQHHHVVFLILDMLSSILFAIDAVRNYKSNRRYFLSEVQVAPSNKEYMDSGVKVKARSLRMQSVEQRNPRLWFMISILAVLPLEYITPMLDGQRQGMGLANFLLLNRFFIMCHLPKYIEDLAGVLESRGIVKNTGIQRAWKLFFAMAIAGHWCCCGFFLVAKVEAMSGFGGVTWPEDLALFALMNDDGANTEGKEEVGVGSIVMLTSIPTAYIQSLYWAYITMVRHI